MRLGFLNRSILCCALLLCTFAIPHHAEAHAFNYGVIKTQLSAEGEAIKLHTVIPSTLNADATTTKDRRRLMQQYFGGNITVTNKQQLCTFFLDSFDDESSSTQTVFDGVFTCTAPVLSLQDLTIHSSIFTDLFLAFDHFVTITIGQERWVMAFSQANQDYPATVEALQDISIQNYVASTSSGTRMSANGAQQPQSTAQIITSNLRPFTETALVILKQFLLLGIFHIWTGYDHILFLLSVILLLRSVKKVLILVTSFTIAHSITLILAGLHIITISPRLVEPLIALTIIYMAVRNLMLLKNKNDEHALPERWITTFGFGLVHGLGFAGALTDVGIPSAFFIPALVIFNVGIEIGQLGILLIAVPALLYIDKHAYRRHALMVISLIIAVVAAFWFIGRLFFGQV